MNTKKPAVDARHNLEQVLAEIPLANALQIRVQSWDHDRLVLSSPYGASRNHHGKAFGGAIECLGTLACWGWLWLSLGDPRLDIVIQTATSRFFAPLTGNLLAQAEPPDPASRAHYQAMLARHSRARIDLHAIIGNADNPKGASLLGRYVITRER